MLDFVNVTESCLRRVLAGRQLEVEMVTVLTEIARRGLREPRDEVRNR
jgi:hypothetical protein